MKNIEKQRILTFDEARKVHKESEDYDRTKWIYVPDFHCEYRYILGTTGNRPLITIGINPSKAIPEDLDPTLKSVARIVAGNGFDSFIMFNVCAQRSTKPKDINQEKNLTLHRENMKAFRWILENSGAKPMIWAAWGNNIERRKYLKECLEDMISIADEYGAQWCKVGKITNKGHPHHPLYLKADSEIEAFDICAYMKHLLRN